MDKIRPKRPSTSTTSATGSAGNETELSPQEVIDGLGPDAFGEKEPEEGARVLHQKLTDFAEKSAELDSGEAPEAKEAFYLRAETKLEVVEEDMARPDSDATHDQRVDFSKGVTIIHSLFAGEEIPSYSSYPTPDEEGKESDEELEQKIAKVVKQYSSGPAPAA